MSDKIVKRGRGRPAGTGYGKDIISKLHRGFNGALARLDARGKSLDELLAEALERDVAGTIRAITPLLPKADTLEVKLSAGGQLSEALADVQRRLASDRAKVIDVEPVDDASVTYMQQSSEKDSD